MFAVLAIGLAVLSVFMWRQEAEAFLSHVHNQMNPAHGGKPGILAALRVVAGSWKILPLVIDISITFSLVSALGLNGGVLGAVIGLAMSNALSFIIVRESKKFRVESSYGVNSRSRKPGNPLINRAIRLIESMR